MALGALALIYGGINYKKEETVLDIGGIKATATEHKTLPISPVAGAAALVAGAVILAVSARKGKLA